MNTSDSFTFCNAEHGAGDASGWADGTPSSDGSAMSPESSKLYAKFYPRLYAYARRLADSAMAEDIVQEVFLRVIKYKQGRVDTLPLQFLLAMTKNVALRMLSARRREMGIVRDEVEPAVSEPGFDPVAASVPGLLERLPERQREAVVLTTAHGLSEHQASLVMNSSRSAVSARRRAGLEHLRRVGLGRLDVSNESRRRGSGRGRPQSMPDATPAPTDEAA